MRDGRAGKEEIAMSEAKTCPKCSGDMKKGYIRQTGALVYPVHFTERISVLDLWRKNARNPKEPTCAFAFKNCGYVELYIEKKK